MSALQGQGFGFVIVRAVILVKEYLGLLKNGEIIKVALVFYHRLAEVGKQAGADIA
jgi:hypothetical protein